MLTTTQARIHDLLANIERLEPLAEAERLAGIAEIENPWKGSIEALSTVTAERDWLFEQQKAENFAGEVARYRDSLERRETVAAEVAELDAKIATFSRETHDYFRACNDLMHWVEQATRPGVHFPVSAIQRDSRGNVLDIPPKCARDPDPTRPLVTEAEWPAVQEFRDLYIKRAIIGQNVAQIDRALRELAAKTPALAFVKARKAVAV